jgi:hypothetical protein
MPKQPFHQRKDKRVDLREEQVRRPLFRLSVPVYFKQRWDFDTGS